MQADSRLPDFCTYLSANLLCGLILNAFFKWWWADPIAALIMVPIIANEGIGAVRAAGMLGRMRLQLGKVRHSEKDGFRG